MLFELERSSNSQLLSNSSQWDVAKTESEEVDISLSWIGITISNLVRNQ